MRTLLLTIAASLTLSACTFAASPGEQPEAPVAAPTLTASGEAQAVQAMPFEENMEWAASVTQVNFLQNQSEGSGVKLFGLAGGDPAMNGLYTQIAFFQSAAEGWRVFRIGDFLDYRVLADSPGRVDLEINESTMNEATGEIGSQTRHMIVTWTLGAEGAAPEAIDVTPASAS